MELLAARIEVGDNVAALIFMAMFFVFCGFVLWLCFRDD